MVKDLRLRCKSGDGNYSLMLGSSKGILIRNISKRRKLWISTQLSKHQAKILENFLHKAGKEME